MTTETPVAYIFQFFKMEKKRKKVVEIQRSFWANKIRFLTNYSKEMRIKAKWLFFFYRNLSTIRQTECISET